MDVIKKYAAGTAAEWPIDRTYTATIHGQQVTVKRYAEGKRPSVFADELESAVKQSLAKGERETPC